MLPLIPAQLLHSTHKLDSANCIAVPLLEHSVVGGQTKDQCDREYFSSIPKVACHGAEPQLRSFGFFPLGTSSFTTTTLPLQNPLLLASSFLKGPPKLLFIVLAPQTWRWNLPFSDHMPCARCCQMLLATISFHFLVIHLVESSREGLCRKARFWLGNVFRITQLFFF